MAKKKYKKLTIKQRISLFTEKAAEQRIMFKAWTQKVWILTELITKSVLIPALIILLVLTLLGYAITIMNYLGSVSLYFVIEEIKEFIKEMNKK